MVHQGLLRRTQKKLPDKSKSQKDSYISKKYLPSGLLMFDIRQSFSIVPFCSVELEYPDFKAVERIRYDIIRYGD